MATIKEWLDRFATLRDAGDWAALIEETSKCIDELSNSDVAWPDEAEVYLIRGFAKDKLKQYQEAIADYDVALALDDQYPEAYNNRGVTKHRLKRYEEAIADFDKAIALDDQYPEAYNNRGNTKYGLERYEEAIKDHDKAIELKSDFAVAYNGRSQAKHKLGQNGEAIEDLTIAIQLEPENIDFRNGLVIAHAALAADETRKSVEQEYKKQLQATQDPIIIIKEFDRDIIEVRYRLYGRHLLLDPTDDEGVLKEVEENKEKVGIGWIREAEDASRNARLLLGMIAFISSFGFYLIHKNPDNYALMDIGFLDILQLTTFVLLLYSPFLLFNKHLSARADKEVTRLHAMIRDRNRLLFWTAQSNDFTQTKRTRLAPLVFEHMANNSTADISLQMMNKGRRDKTEKTPATLMTHDITARLDNIETALKNLTPNRSE